MNTDVWLRAIIFGEGVIVLLIMFGLKLFWSLGIAVKGLQTWTKMHQEQDDERYEVLKEMIEGKTRCD